MTPREIWNSYVSRHGGPVGVAERLDVPYSTIACICNGSRGIGRRLAKHMAAQDPLLDESVLVWVTAEKKSRGEAPQHKQAV